jgi:effector-binding domain-containing protein
VIETPHITESEAQTTAVIRLTIPREEIRTVMAPGIGELMAVVADQGIGPAGPWFTHYLRMDPEIFDFEIGVPVSEPAVPQGRVEPGELPATTVLRTVYHGPYDGLGAAWAEFDRWIAENGHTPGPDLWERYLVGPEISDDAETWRTELNRPLAE